MGDYKAFLESKQRRVGQSGFKPMYMPDFLFDFQANLTEWAVRTGRSAIFSDCGTGKSVMELVWAENVVRKTKRPVLIFTPLAVAAQFVREGEKFGMKVNHAREGIVKPGINVVNYQRMHYFKPSDFGGVVCDESSCLKHHNSETRKNVTTFATKIPYVLLGTATPAPNDFMELGTSAEALGSMKYHQMLGMFFVNDGETTSQWRLRGHAKKAFWQWVAGWARAMRKPSDLGYEDDGFILPPLEYRQHVVPSPLPEFGLFAIAARTLAEQRSERRKTIKERCELVASLSPKDRPFIVWCHLNAEGDLLEKLLPDAVQVAGSDDNEVKEDRLDAFSRGEIRGMVTKPKIGGFGLNWQHCSDVTSFVSHSYESWYQAIRRCWRFGQKRPVTVNIVISEGESLVLGNMLRKEKAASEMYDGIVREMGAFQKGESNNHTIGSSMEVPSWLSRSK